MEPAEQSEFIDQHRKHNTGCLLEYIKEKHFSDYYYGPESDGMKSMVDCLQLTIRRYNLVG